MNRIGFAVLLLSTCLSSTVLVRANQVPPSQLRVWSVEENVIALKFDKLDRERAIAEKMEARLAQFPISDSEKAEFSKRLAEAKEAHAALVSLGVLSAVDSSFIYQGKLPSGEILQARHRYEIAIVRLTDGNPWGRMIDSIQENRAPRELVQPLRAHVRFEQWEWARRTNHARADLFNAIAANGNVWNSRWFPESKLDERRVDVRSVFQTAASEDLRRFAAICGELVCYTDARGVRRCVRSCP